MRLLLAGLLAHAPHPLSVDRLVELLWAERLPHHPANALQTKVSRLRRVLDAAEPGARDLIVSLPAGYALTVAPDHTDLGCFTSLTTRARAAQDLRTRASLLTRALDLWRGDPFDGVRGGSTRDDDSGDTVVRPVRERLAEERLGAIEDLAEARLALGEHRYLTAELEEAARRNPLRERLRALHLRALYGSGRQAEALTAYAELRELLARELGADPGPQLAALHQAMLRQDPSLSATPPS
ncbi:AfsR/SARP family transcriptional regulator, partial [Streptomyces boluensis]|uniref:AfsR/SARP family transcriptional regulator n=1 Tax=Streptomyces boluensis TaxID=1775135 RepID=UPI0035E41466